MLRNTGDGNELALPATNALQRSIVWVDWLLYQVAGLAGWCASLPLCLSLRWHAGLCSSEAVSA